MNSKKNKLRGTLLVVAMFALPASSEINYPLSGTMLLNQSGERDAIELECEDVKTNGDRLHCDFIQVHVSYETNPEELDSEIADRVARIDSYSEQNKSESLAEVRAICKDEEEMRTAINAKILTSQESPKKQLMEKMAALLDRTCDIDSVEQARDWGKEMMKVTTSWEAKTCKVWLNTWSQEFTLQQNPEDSYWLSDAVPSGDCGVLNISTLKRDGEFFWRYDSRRVVTNKEGKALLKCSEIEEIQSSYTWRQADYLVDCQEIKFGFYLPTSTERLDPIAAPSMAREKPFP